MVSEKSKNKKLPDPMASVVYQSSGSSVVLVKTLSSVAGYSVCQCSSVAGLSLGRRAFVQ